MCKIVPKGKGKGIKNERKSPIFNMPSRLITLNNNNAKKLLKNKNCPINKQIIFFSY